MRFTGEEAQFLRDVRAGKFEYDLLINMADEQKAELEALCEESSLPNSVNMKDINKLYIQLTEL